MYRDNTETQVSVDPNRLSTSWAVTACESAMALLTVNRQLSTVNLLAGLSYHRPPSAVR
jgi:hypothetical protein